ncbi:Uncharacterised protein [Vibrio cholerae]|nr:Uncharacterised protein [Vibrio cholerae]
MLFNFKLLTLPFLRQRNGIILQMSRLFLTASIHSIQRRNSNRLLAILFIKTQYRGQI